MDCALGKLFNYLEGKKKCRDCGGTYELVWCGYADCCLVFALQCRQCKRVAKIYIEKSDNGSFDFEVYIVPKLYHLKGGSK